MFQYSYKIIGTEIKIDLLKEVEDIISNYSEIDFSNGVNKKNKDTIRKHLFNTIKSNINLNTRIRFLIEKKVDKMIDDLIRNIHVIFILYHNR